ncbi:CHAT domain-containing protein [Paraliomyxa miuraensis]|uniref:CHAT domain-containing protein n=1 Tax=Paraliomyxa miuraensis TaxID=376150 RepID=UPI00224F7501|nr:CHAT domain-containing protein [Paraliomyxa miuraensis]MCX4244788.1 CHAT domain-containing protein [Paraliomyxa miuraensis]
MRSLEVVSPTPVSRPPSRPLPPPQVLFGGCEEQGPGPTCVLSTTQRTLTLWVDVPSVDAIAVSIDGVPVQESPVVVEQGLRWTIVDVPVEATRLSVRWADSQDGEAYALVLRTAEPAVLAERERLGEEIGAAADAAAFDELYERARRSGHWSLGTKLAHTQAFRHIHEKRDLAGGRRWLERARVLLPHEDGMHLFHRGLLAETRGDLGEALFAYRRAIHQGRAIGAMPLVELAVLGQALTIMTQMGDRDGAAEALREGLRLARSPSIDVFNHATFLDTAAWAVLMSRSSPGGALSSYQPRELLDRARVLLGDEPEGRGAWFTVRLNLAYDALERGETAVARRWLDTLDGRRLIRSNELWHRLLSARLERLEGELEPARRRLRAMVDDAERHQDHGLRWAARVEHARVLEQLGRVPEALAEYAQADLVLEQQLPVLALVDRERFLIGRDAVTRHRVELLLDEGQPAAALCVARLARTRALRSLDQRMRRDADDDTRRALDEYLGTRLRLDEEYDRTFWTASSAARAARRRKDIEREREANEQRFEAIMRRPGQGSPSIPGCEGFSRPEPGAIDLHYVQLDRGWVGFSMDEAGTVVHRWLEDPSPGLEGGDAQRLGAVLLEPFADALVTARRARVMATGPLFGVAFHSLPFGPSGRLQDEHTVVYGLDLPRAPARTHAQGPALVLAPPSNLPRAHDEASLSRAALERLDLAVEVVGGALDGGGDEPPLFAARVLAALPRASWFHYVGHARSDGLGGWDSELVLAADGTAVLRVPDVLALSRVPATVILSGCQTGVVDPRTSGGGMSLAHAFVLAGAQVVVATTEEIGDDESAALMGMLYDGLDGPDADAAARALASAQRRARAEAEGSSAWRLVRAWVP